MTPETILTEIANELDVEQRDAAPGVYDDGKEYRLWMRDWTLFTDRAGVEDDDHPNFTGCDKVAETAEAIAGPEGWKVQVWPSEKRWFCVAISK